jgi:hypothetical protein
MKKKEYRVNARHVGLTYPQCTQALGEVLSKVSAKSKTLIEKYLIVRESHEDGGKHVHVYLKYERPINILNPHQMDLEGEDGESKHGKYESIRNPAQWIKYLLKGIKDPGDENILYSPNMAGEITSLGEYRPYTVQMMSLAESGKIQEAMELYRKNSPSQFVKG